MLNKLPALEALLEYNIKKPLRCRSNPWSVYGGRLLKQRSTTEGFGRTVPTFGRGNGLSTALCGSLSDCI